MAANENQQAKPAIMIRSQYIKDMSLEIPLAPEIFKDLTTQPQIHVDMNMKSEKQDDGSYVVSLITKMDADINDKKLFIVELTYSAQAEINVPEEQKEPVLMIELPRLMFPFVRSIISNALAQAGLPPIMLSPIDFVTLYNAKKAQEAEMAQAENAKK
ncbi:MAG: protein-export chaperone SecB [Alphaproteobacteria bacterium]|nr:protein-export chaperone SecB [Alphaproteobacteria bacterium]MBR3662072.1 protein-export chaperone SecB [Alphaproteobacteria bacterium]